MLRSRFLALSGILLLAACGTNPTDRALTGGGIGAAGGAIIGAVTGLTVLQGALIGTGLGAAFGGLTKADQVYLGEPVWKNFDSTPVSRSSTSTSNAPKTSNLVAATQANLARLGYQPGPIDGQIGGRTRAAIRQYQQDHGLPVNGNINGQIAMEIENKAAGIPN